ncbi:MAG: DUF362 domain-containing protein [Ignavibacteriaceae bacterium]
MGKKNTDESSKRKFSRRTFLKTIGTTSAGLMVAPYIGTSNIFAYGREEQAAFLAKVAITKADNYERAFIKGKVQYLFEQIGGITDIVKAGDKVAIKINLTGGGSSCPYNMWTHPEVLRAVGELVIDCGVSADDLYIVEAIWSQSSYNDYGYKDVQDSLGAKLVDLNQPAPYGNFIQKEVGTNYFNFSSLTLNQILSDVDVYISIPKMKQHYEAGITCSCKNQIGIVPKDYYTIPSNQGNRAALHNPTGDSSKSYLPRSICDLNSARPVNLAVIDGIMNARGGEGTWNPTFQISEDHVLLAGKDPVATDSVSAYFMGIDPGAEKIPLPNPDNGECDNHLYLLNQIGAGTNKMSEIEIVGDGSDLIVLPVELTSFTAKINNNNIELNWETKTETNNRGFEIERYNNQWSRVGFMKGHGSTTEASNYTFIDKIVSGKLVKYRLKQIDYDGSFTYSRVVEVKLQLVEDYKLCQNYPNPFNPTTTISYTIPENGHVLLEVYNSLGQKAETLVNKTLQAGIHNITWNAQYVPSGVYFYKITVNNFSQTNKMVLMK